VALAECCAATDDVEAMIGADVTLPEGEPHAAALFGEAPSRVVISACPADVPEILRRAAEKGVPARAIGAVGGVRLTIRRGGAVLVDADLLALRDARERCLESIVGS
jgi:phosphoribosylformylglycinamidine synthase